VEDVAERMRATLEDVWKRLSAERPDLANKLATVDSDLAVIDATVREMVTLLEAALTAGAELRQQRDEALDRLAFLEPGKRNQAILDLAKYISWDADIPPADVQRLLEVLSGDSDLWVSEYTKDDFFAALRKMAQELFEEATYQAALEEEEETE